MLIVTHDKATRKTTVAVGFDRLHLGLSEDMILLLQENGAAALLAAAETLLLTIKPATKRDVDRLVSVSITSADLHANSGTYRKTFSTYTDEALAHFGVNVSDADDVIEQELSANITYTPSGGAAEPGHTFPVTIENTTFNPEDASPGSTTTPDAEWVAHGHAQTLTVGQKLQARTNIGAAEAAAVATDIAAALVTAATLTENEQVNDYTLVLGDGNGRTLVSMNKATAVNLTIPPNASVALPIGRPISVLAKGAGETSITPDTGVTLNGATAPVAISEQWKAATLLQLSANAWWVTGSLA